MGLKNPQAQFEDGIFGPGGMHPTPATLPYPSQPLKTIYGETVEYLIPVGQKEKVLKKLYPFGDPPPLNTVLARLSTFASTANFFCRETPHDAAVGRESPQIAVANAV